MAPNRPFPVDPVLTAIAIGYRNPSVNLIATRALPPLQVQQEIFSWTEYPVGESFTLPNTKVGRKGRPNEVEFTGVERQAAVDDYGLDSSIPQSDIQAAEAARAQGRSLFDPKATAAQGLTNLIGLDREVRVATVVQDPANYSVGRKVTLTAGDQFSASGTSDPYGVIDHGFTSTLIYRPNTVTMGGAVWNVLKKHPNLIKAVKGGLAEDGAITRQQFADLFEISLDRLLIGEGMLNTAKPGQPVSLTRVWGKSIQLYYIDQAKQTADDTNITFGFTAELGQRISGSIPDPDIGLQGGERVRVGERVKELVCAKDVGYQIADAIA